MISTHSTVSSSAVREFGERFPEEQSWTTKLSRELLAAADYRDAVRAEEIRQHATSPTFGMLGCDEQEEILRKHVGAPPQKTYVIRSIPSSDSAVFVEFEGHVLRLDNSTERGTYNVGLLVK
jgi:hypothetical protein